MKGDFSRDTFDRAKHYSRVLMQQGRVQVDADWNEQQAINTYRVETEAKDVVGACGAPVGDAGFGITPDAKTLKIGKGRIYVDGILCENDADLDYFKQPDFPMEPNAPNVQDILKATDLGIVYLDVWQRHLTALDDDLIREKALGGPDTATRVKTIWQVRVLPVKGPDPKECSRLEKERSILQAKIDELQSALAKAARSKSKPATRKTLSAASQLDGLKRELAVLEVMITEVCGAVECITPFPGWDALFPPKWGMMNARTTIPDNPDDVCLIPPSAGYTRLENQLYRVEIHQGGNFPADTVTFKWSRDNGTVVTAITKISGNVVTVHDLGPDAELGFANGQLVEILDDLNELKGTSSQLLKIDDATTLDIKLNSNPTPLASNADGVDKTRHPKLRRWDRVGALTANTWIPLESGIEVQFSEGTYKTGDYWLIPARTATGEIEWPPFETPNKPVAQPRRGIQHHYCRLALVTFDGKKLSVQQDCRDLFYPLAESALHVTNTSWQNDDVLAQGEIQKGLQIWFDVVPDKLSLVGGAQPDSSPTVIVSVEVPLDSKAPGTTPDITIILDAQIVVLSDSILLLVKDTPRIVDALVSQQSFVRVRVTLKGHKIFSQRDKEIIYLDGQAFGRTGKREKDGTPCIDLNFPSGSGARASDFESWFYVGVQPPKTKPPLQVTAVNLISDAGEKISALLKQQPGKQDPVQIINLVTAEITFNRAPIPASIIPNSVFVFTSDGATKTRHPGQPSVSGNIATLKLEKPVHNGALEVAGGVDNSFKPLTSPVKAHDDGSALDGDYDKSAGGDFVLPFFNIG
jgi:hypothetical protein